MTAGHAPTLRPVRVEPAFSNGTPPVITVYSAHAADGHHLGDLELWSEGTGAYPFVVWSADRRRSMTYRRRDAALRWLGKQP